MYSARPPAIMHGIVVVVQSDASEERAKQVRMRIQAIATTCMGGRVRAVVSTAVVLPTYIIATMHAACSHA